jgi:hypothetical protein
LISPNHNSHDVIRLLVAALRALLHELDTGNRLQEKILDAEETFLPPGKRRPSFHGRDAG